MIYDYHCSCGWKRSIKIANDAATLAGPDSICCADCGTGKDIRWFRKRPDQKFTPPESAKQKFGPQPWAYVPTAEEMAVREKLERERAPVQVQYALRQKEAPAPTQQTLAGFEAPEPKKGNGAI